MSCAVDVRKHEEASAVCAPPPERPFIHSGLCCISMMYVLSHFSRHRRREPGRRRCNHGQQCLRVNEDITPRPIELLDCSSVLRPQLPALFSRNAFSFESTKCQQIAHVTSNFSELSTLGETMADEIDVIESEDDTDSLPSYKPIHKPDPIIIRGVGQFTIFGLSSRFDAEFPAALTGKLAPEELEETMQRINYVLQRTMHGHGRWLLCGILFCCCTFGCSLWPMICLNSRAIAALEKTLDYENQQLYNKLGLHWRLARQQIENAGTLVEYVLVLESIPLMPLNMPE
uniref:Erf4 domain-containing protein n=1 Tax=Panagrellus redivivus TaxID=6233 RepID=A0A7E4VUM2_PANRE